MIGDPTSKVLRVHGSEGIFNHGLAYRHNRLAVSLQEVGHGSNVL